MSCDDCKKLRKDLKDLRDQLTGNFEKIDGSFENIDRNFEKISGNFEKFDENFEKIDGNFQKINGNLDSLIRLILLNHSKMDLFMRTMETEKFSNSLESLTNGINPLSSIFPQIFANFGSAFFSSAAQNQNQNILIAQNQNKNVSMPVEVENSIANENFNPTDFIFPAGKNSSSTAFVDVKNSAQISAQVSARNFNRSKKISSNSNASTSNFFNESSIDPQSPEIFHVCNGETNQVERPVERFSSNSDASTSNFFNESSETFNQQISPSDAIEGHRLPSGGGLLPSDDGNSQLANLLRCSSGGRNSVEEEQQVCPVCAKILKNRVLKQHLRYVHGTPSERCDICSRVFSRISDLRRHVRSVHQISKIKGVALQTGMEDTMEDFEN